MGREESEREKAKEKEHIPVERWKRESVERERARGKYVDLATSCRIGRPSFDPVYMDWQR